MKSSIKLADDDMESIIEEDMMSRRSRKINKPKDWSRSKASKSLKKIPKSPRKRVAIIRRAKYRSSDSAGLGGFCEKIYKMSELRAKKFSI